MDDRMGKDKMADDKTGKNKMADETTAGDRMGADREWAAVPCGRAGRRRPGEGSAA